MCFHGIVCLLSFTTAGYSNMNLRKAFLIIDIVTKLISYKQCKCYRRAYHYTLLKSCSLTLLIICIFLSFSLTLPLSLTPPLFSLSVWWYQAMRMGNWRYGNGEPLGSWPGSRRTTLFVSVAYGYRTRHQRSSVVAGTGRYISGTDSLTSIFHIHIYLAYFKVFFFLFKRGFYAVISFNWYIIAFWEL